MGTDSSPTWWRLYTKACSMLIIGLGLLGLLALVAKWAFGIIGGIWYGN